MNRSELAEQSIFAVLDVRRVGTKAPVSRVQDENDRLLTTYAAAQNLSKIDPTIHRIDNLPATIKTIPVDSIFSYILYIDPRGPDVRFVPVSTEAAKPQNQYPTAGSLRAFPSSGAPIATTVSTATAAEAMRRSSATTPATAMRQTASPLFKDIGSQSLSVANK